MKTFYRILTAALAAGAASGAMAQLPGAAVQQAAASLLQQAPQNSGAIKAGSASIAPTLAAASNDKLGAERAKGGEVENDARLSGVVAGNTASNMVTGANSIATGSFANMAGLPVVIQNTGANVLIQNSTIVNVQFR